MSEKEKRNRKLLISGFALAVILIVVAVGYIYLQPRPDSDKDGVPDSEDEFPGRDDKEFRRTLNVATVFEPITLDGRTVFYGATNAINMQIYEPLVKYKGETSEVEPVLAERWEISSDGLTYTFYLRKGVKFHDGTPFNASAAKSGFETCLAINGVPATYISMVDKIEAVDVYTLRFRLKTPFAPFLGTLACPAMWQQIVSPTYVKAYATKDDPYAQKWMTDHACGTGPYMLVEWVRDVRVVFNKFPDYWRGWQGKHIERVVFLTIRESTTQRMMLEKGDIDIAENIPYVELAPLNKTKGVVSKVFTKFYDMQYYAWMSCHRPPLNDPRVRKAICYSIDYEKIHKDIMNGYGEYSHGSFPPFLPYHDPTIPLYKRDIAKAKELMKQAGWPEKTNITLRFNGQSGIELHRLVGELIQSNLREIGINVEVLEFPWPVRHSRYLKPETADDFMFWYMTPYYYDPDLFLFGHLHSSKIPPLGWNYGYYSSPKVDKLIEQGRTELDPAKRAKIYKELQWLLFEEQPFVPLLNMPFALGLRDWVNGRVYNPSYSRTHNLYDMWKAGVPGRGY